MSEQDSDTNIVAETENYLVIRSEDTMEGYFFHVILGGVTLNLTSEEWNELVMLIKGADG